MGGREAGVVRQPPPCRPRTRCRSTTSSSSSAAGGHRRRIGRGGRLPRELELGRTYGVSRITVRGASSASKRTSHRPAARPRPVRESRPPGSRPRQPRSQLAGLRRPLRRAGIRGNVKVTACEAGVGPQEALDALGLEPETECWRVRRQGLDGGGSPVARNPLLPPQVPGDPVRRHHVDRGHQRPPHTARLPDYGERWRLEGDSPPPGSAACSRSIRPRRSCAANTRAGAGRR